MDCVIQLKLVIPIFHTEFDALQVSYTMFGEIPPYGEFGDFLWLLWLLSRPSLVFKFNDIPFPKANGMGRKMAHVDFLANGFKWWKCLKDLCPVRRVILHYNNHLLWWRLK